jgi:hypothetical protein
MIPIIAPGKTKAMFEQLLKQYGLNQTNSLTRATPAMVENFVQHPFIRSLITLFANRIPPEQSDRAMRYFQSVPGNPRYVVGHSLGGALAKIVAMKTSTTAVAFNSPFMGDLKGTLPQSSPRIISVNTKGDPVSLATKAVGNLSHGRTINVAISPPSVRPLQVPKWKLGWRLILDPYGELIKPQAAYINNVFDHLLIAILHYHDMKNLHSAIKNNPRFKEGIAQ